MTFSDDEIADLLGGRSPERWKPLLADNLEDLEKAYRRLVPRIERQLGMVARVEWDHYGSGYASYIDAWFYFADGRARLSGLIENGEHHCGIFVLLSRLTRFYVVGQGEKTWHATGGSGYLPDLKNIDSIRHPALLPVEKELDWFLQRNGLERLRTCDVHEHIPSHFEVPTILADPPYTLYDALFHWED